MPRDYAKSNYSNRRKKRGTRRQTNHTRGKTTTRKKTKNNSSFMFSAAWIAMGILLTLFAAGLIYLKYHSHHSTVTHQIAPENAPHKKNTTQRKSNTQIAKITPSKTQPQFDFYTILPKSQPEEPKAEISKESETPTQHVNYILQVASLKNYEEADRLKAELLLEGFKVNITKTTTNHSTWFRVNVGPFDDVNAAENDQDKLRLKHLNSLLLRAG